MCLLAIESDKADLKILPIAMLPLQQQHCLKNGHFRLFPDETRIGSKILEVGSSKTNEILSSGLNFINILSAAFTLVDPKSIKRH